MVNISSRARKESIEGYSYEEMQSTWEALVQDALNSLSSEQREKVPSVIFPESIVSNVSHYLTQEKAEHAGQRLLFIPYEMEGRWVSVMLSINSNDQLMGVECIDSVKGKLNVELLQESIQLAYPDFRQAINVYEGSVLEEEVDPALTSIVAMENGESLLRRLLHGKSHPIESRVCDESSVLVIRRRHYSLLNEQSLFFQALPFLMQNKGVPLDAETLSSLLQTSRSGMKTITRVEWRVRRLLGQERSMPIALGGCHSFLWGSKDNVYALGANEVGQLGLGHSKDQFNWTEAKLPKGVAVKEIVARAFHSFLITQSGELYACGNNKFSKLGLPLQENLLEWTRVPLPDNVALKKIITGPMHSFLITQSGELYACGDNRYGQLGLNHYIDMALSWKKVKLPGSITVKQVIVTDANSFLIDDTGDLYQCGFKTRFVCARGEQRSFVKVPLPDGVALAKMTAGHGSIYLITESGQLYVAGVNLSGQLGLGHNSTQFGWAEIKLPKGVAVKQVIAGVSHSFLITESGKLYACGNNKYGQLGLGYNENQNRWTEVKLPASITVKEIIAGYDFSFLITQSGELYGCGNNRYGQLNLNYLKSDLLKSVLKVVDPYNHKGRSCWTEVVLPNGFSFGPFLPFTETFTAVQQYLSSGASIESMQELVRILSAEQLLLVPYHLRDEDVLRLNQLAYEALQPDLPESAVSRAPVSSLVSQSLFSVSDDNSSDYSVYDSSENYLVMYKRVLEGDPSMASAVSDMSDGLRYCW